MHQWEIFNRRLYIFTKCASNTNLQLYSVTSNCPLSVCPVTVQFFCSVLQFHDSLLKCSSNLLTLHHLHTVNQLAMSHNYFHAFLQFRHDKNSLHYVMKLGCPKRTGQQALPPTQSTSTQSNEVIICSTHHHDNHQQLSHTTFTILTPTHKPIHPTPEGHSHMTGGC